MTQQRNNKDCLICCLADLLEIDYESIPKFYKLNVSGQPEDIRLFDAWLYSIGYYRILTDVEFDAERAHVKVPYLSLPVYALGVVQKPSRVYAHIVIVHLTKDSLTIVHDPKPDSDYTIKDIIQIEFIVKIGDLNREKNFPSVAQNNS